MLMEVIYYIIQNIYTFFNSKRNKISPLRKNHARYVSSVSPKSYLPVPPFYLSSSIPLYDFAYKGGCVWVSTIPNSNSQFTNLALFN
jgi:hypothetical protein